MIPTSARRRIVIKMLIDYSTGWVTPRRRIEKKTTSQSSAEAPSYTVTYKTVDMFLTCGVFDEYLHVEKSY